MLSNVGAGGGAAPAAAPATAAPGAEAAAPKAEEKKKEEEKEESDDDMGFGLFDCTFLINLLDILNPTDLTSIRSFQKLHILMNLVPLS